MINLLDAVYKLGKLYIEKEDLDELEVLLDNKNIGAVLSINFIEDENGNFSYDKLIQEEYDESKRMNYLYKKGSPNGADITPSCLITEPEKTFNNKFMRWFNQNQSKYDLFKKLYDEITNSQEVILSNLIDTYNDMQVGTSNILLTLSIIFNSQINYIGDYEEFKEILKENSFEKYYKKGSKEIKGESTCFLCEEHKEVYGLVSSAIGFAFSTPEKVGNVPNNLIENQWKLLPICGDCALYLEAGKKFIEKYLNFSDFGLTYYVIPNFLFDSKEGFDSLYPILKSMYSDENQNSTDVPDIENKLKFLVGNMNDIVEFKFLFYESSKSEFKILAYVESVIPSWLNNLYDVQLKISKDEFFAEENIKKYFGDKLEGNFFNFIRCSSSYWYPFVLRDFVLVFSRKIYLDLIVNIINGNKLDYNFVLSRVMDKLQSNWRKKEFYALNVNIYKSLALLLFLNELNLIKGVENMNLDENFDLDSFLNTPSKKSSFLIGVLTRKLINIQFNELHSRPFYNKLWGLSLNHKKIIKLFPMVVDKLRQYDAWYYVKLEDEIRENLILSQNNWNLNTDETSYYFVLGFTFKDYGKEVTEGEKNE